MSPRRTRVVVIGAGFAGTLTARRLAEKRNLFEVTLINPDQRFFFTPRLIDALALPDDSPMEHCSADLQEIALREDFQFRCGTATQLNRMTKMIDVCSATGSVERLPYDIVVLSPGATTNYYDIPGAESHSLQIKEWKNIRTIHAAIDSQIAVAMNATTDDERRRALSLVVVGGGLSGIEAASILQSYIVDRLKERAERLIPLASFLIIQAGPQILNGFHHRLVAGVEKELCRQGIQIRTGSPVAEVNAHSIRTTTGEIIPAGILIWCAGIKANVVPMTPEVGRDNQGGVLVDAALRIDDHVVAAGDAIAFRHKNVGIPKNAQTALRMARHIAAELERGTALKHHRPFTYTSLGTMVLLAHTCFLETFGVCIQAPWVKHLRNIFYRFRFLEAVGRIEE